jgi:hypothetical protein
VTFREDPRVIRRQDGKSLWLAEFRDSEGNTLALRQ